MKLLKGIAFVVLLAGLVLLGRHFLLNIPKTDTPLTTQVSPTPSSPAPTPASEMVEAGGGSDAPLQARDREQIRVLDEILESKNDNDPRMDRLLRDLSEPFKKELRAKYARIPAEKRNDRGTVVFLVGREIAEGRGSTADLQFLKDVLMEKPCLSLEDCSKSPSGVGPDEQHLEAIHETTLHYPQLMDLRYLKIALEQGSLSPVMREAVLAILESARQSPNPRVVADADATLGTSNDK